MSVACHSVFLCQPKFGVEEAFSRDTTELRREIQDKLTATRHWAEPSVETFPFSVFYFLPCLIYFLLYLQEKDPLSVLLKAVVGPLQHRTSEKCTSGHTQEKDLTTAQNQDVGGHLLAQLIIKTM